MSKDVEVKGLQEVVELVKKVGAVVTRDIMQSIAYDYQKVVIDRMTAGKFQPLSPLTQENRVKSGKPLTDKSNLLNSIRNTVTDTTAEIGSSLKYARIHEYGGTIKAKKKYLWIPANKEVARYAETYGISKTIDFLKKKYKFWVGKNAAFIQTGKGASTTKIAFILKKSVKIPQRSYLRPQPADSWVFDHAFEMRTGLKK